MELHDWLEGGYYEGCNGEYILTVNSPSGSGVISSNNNTEKNDINENNQEELLSRDLNLNDTSPIAIAEDSLGLNDNFGLEDDFPSELLNDPLLDGIGVEGLLSNDSLGLPDGFNLEEALQLVGLNEVNPDEGVKSEGKSRKDCAKSLESGENFKDEASSCSCDEDADDEMIHTPQFHHPHHRSFQ
ncbi:hypothetical protein PV325_010304, partial [Microctonus aethiopoides]